VQVSISTASSCKTDKISGGGKMNAKTDITTKSKEKKLFRTTDITYIGAAVALITICSWISIPTTIPFTLQTFAVMLTVLLLGGMRGTIAITVYILLGAVGVPVFAGFSGGIARLMGPTGGYIIGFIASSLIMWMFENISKKRYWLKIVSMLLGLAACYALGTLWFMHTYTAKDGSSATLMMTLGWCVYPFIIPDLIKLAVALGIGMDKNLRNVIHGSNN
jgi:biotin transport system substrate-specific component